MNNSTKFGDKANKEEDSKEHGLGVNPFLSFILINEYKTIDGKGLLKKYNEICDKEYKALNIERNENTVTFIIDGNIGFISLMPVPFPSSDLEGPCQTSWVWKDASKELKNHKQHIIISWMAKESNPVMISKIVSQITASVLEEVNGIGVYWGAAHLVNKKDVFCDMIYGIENIGLPLFLWIDFRIERHPCGEFNLVTYGLENYGVMEIEIIKSSKSFDELIDFALNIASYLIDNGNVIKDGDTLGEDENQKIVARHASSVCTNDDRGLVLRMEY